MYISLSANTVAGLPGGLECRQLSPHDLFFFALLPAGSLRWERFVRSSLASRMAGFIKGGRDASWPSCRTATVVSTVFD